MNNKEFTLMERLACQGAAPHAKRSRAFTLIELLVVVSIIAILAALLLPVLARAKYKARLVLCMSNVRQVAMGATSYATDGNNLYPVRHALEPDCTSPNSNGFPFYVNSRYYRDDRPHINPYIPLDELQCPFVSPHSVMDSTSSSVKTSYSFYFGFQFNNGDAKSKKMKKVGDVMSFRGTAFDIIVSDVNVGYMDYSLQTYGSHPDYGLNTMTKTGSNPSFYKNPVSYYRGLQDLNYARTDGSAFTVRRIKSVDQYSFTSDRVKVVPWKYHRSSKWVGKLNSLMPSVDD